MNHVSPRPLGERERFVAFAFAAADLLVEVGGDGRICFAAGAFRARLGQAPDHYVGHLPTELVAPEDRGAFANGLAMLPMRGRMPPTAFRLADAARTPISVSGLYLLASDEQARLCLAFAPLPAPPEERRADGAMLLREAEQTLAAGRSSRLDLIELHGLADGAAAPDLERLLREGAGDAPVAALIAPGRYGVLSDAEDGLPDLDSLMRRLGDLLGQQHPGVTVTATAVQLAQDGLTPRQAARALRHGLAAFARAGSEGMREAGFADGLGQVVAKVGARAGALRRAISGRRFRLAFQPIVCLASREVHHHEALIRLEPGVLAPGEGPQDFVALAETIGLTEELDLAVAGLAIAAAKAVPAGRSIAFNISGLSAQSPRFRDRLFALLDRDPAGARKVMVELTESAEIEDDETTAATLRQLRARGVPVCIDDFGAGAAAFRYLKSFPSDYVKVDGAYVAAALTSERDRSFVAAMVDLSLAVGAKVVAEAIETEEAAQAMQALGVHYGQGYWFGRPGSL